MEILISFFALLNSANSLFNLEPFSDDQISYINDVAKTTWKAGRNYHPDDLERVKMMLGVDMEKNAFYNRYLTNATHEPINLADLPTSFDARTQFPNCSSIKEVRDQSSCGSCWAFGSVEAMSDRICIKYGKTVHLSASDLMECCSECGEGCNGGYPALSYNYYVASGIVTGGNYNTSKGCMPYPFPKCEHDVSGKYPPCKSKAYPTPKCQHKCESSYSKTYAQDKHYGSKAYKLNGVVEIMHDLVTKGPVTASFEVYADFPFYRSGVYQHVTGEYKGGHSAKIIGYGTENGVDYWLVANSWNEDWGDKGFFKIKRGNNECAIESSIVAGDPKE